MKKKEKKSDDPPSSPSLSADHFDLTMSRLEDAYLKPIKEDVDEMEKSMTKIKICIEILGVILIGAGLLYIITTVLYLLRII